MKNKKRRVWTRDELIIAYYISRYGYIELGISRSELLRLLGFQQPKSLEMQIANFRWLMGIEGPQLSHPSQAMRDLCYDFNNKTRSHLKSFAHNALRDIKHNSFQGLLRHEEHPLVEEVKIDNQLTLDI